jgi:hypothetical protein
VQALLITFLSRYTTIFTTGKGIAGTWSKMAMGMARVAQALGTSTMPDRRPSQGQQDSSRYTCRQGLLF